MYLTKKHLSRRTVLKGAGVALGLPLLDAMIPAATALANTAAAPRLRASRTAPSCGTPCSALRWIGGRRAARATASS